MELPTATLYRDPQKQNFVEVFVGEHVTPKQRLNQELDLLKQQWRVVALAGFVTAYGSLIVFRNLAFYRFPFEEHRLKDLGHEIIPVIDTNNGLATYMLETLDVLVGILLLYSFVGNRTYSQKPFCVNILVRWLVCIAVASTLRFFTFITTSLPGSAEYCLKSDTHTLIKPLSLSECFTKVQWDFDGNCGDLMFSGHVMHTIITAFVFQTYGKDIMMLKKRTHNALMVLIWLYVVVQSIIIVGMRHHYTADVVAASYITPMVWWCYEFLYRPRELEPRMHLKTHQGCEEDSFGYQRVTVKDSISFGL